MHYSKVGHAKRMEEKRGPYRVLVGILEYEDHLKDLDVDGNTILKWIFRSGMCHGLD